jgi:2-polyprenyl-6-methoxyphenol hydroxylase-like FAD-dependent oxidoreductase
LHVIIIGGGIGGLAAGIAVRRADHDVRVFERTSVLGEVGAGISLWANALRALDSLGVLEAVRARGVADAVGVVQTWDGRPLSRFPLDELRQLVGNVCLVVHRAELQSILAEALGADHVRFGAEAVAVDQDDAGVEVRFADGDVQRGDVLVGADGLHSVVRATLHGEHPPAYAGYTAWRAVVAFDHRRLHAGESWGAGARFGQIPIGADRVYWFATENAPEGARASEGERAHLLRLFCGWHAPIEELLRATDEVAILRNDIYDRPVLRSWGRGRITLLGDAAHPMTPNLGQGACQALEDAVAVAEALDRVAADPTAALRAYEVRRMSRANGVVTQSHRIGVIGQWKHPVAVAVRNALVSRVSPGVQLRQMKSLLTVFLAALACCLALAGCAPAPDLSPSASPSRVAVQVEGRWLSLRLSSPLDTLPHRSMLLYVTGDGGWRGKDLDTWRHLMSLGRPAAGFSAPDYLDHLRNDADSIPPSVLTRDFWAIIVAARRALGVEDGVAVTLVGVSRGAGLVVVAASDPMLRPLVSGVLAVALTGEEEYVRHRLRLPFIRRAAHDRAGDDDLEMAKPYQLLPRIEVPVALIQSSHDQYVPAGEARLLFGPDTVERRFHGIESRDHSFSDRRQELYRAIADSLDWLAGAVHAGQARHGR